jgi:1,4-alpha-glucan branching enzyme
MGQELMCDSPFLFFCDFGPDFADSVSEGRRREFAAFPQFADPSGEVDIPDPNDPETFLRSKIDWGALGDEAHQRWLSLHRKLLEIRRSKLVPLLNGFRPGQTRWEMIGSRGIWVQWMLGEGGILTLTANLDARALRLPPGHPPAPGEVVFSQPDRAFGALEQGELPPWSVVWHLRRRPGLPG